MTDKIVNRTIGPVEIRRRLGGGGMGDVYEGFHRRLEIPVVVKVIRPELTSDRGLVKRFLQEARLAASLRHPGIVRVYDVDLHGQVPFFVMELLEGVSLDAIMVREGRIQPARAIQIVLQVVEALAHAHQRGVIHRDVKPDNVMVDSRWHAVLTDFGLAVLRRARLRLTEPGTPVGTPHYASPEQLGGRPGVDGRSDLYSLGVVLYEMLTGQLPFPETTGVDGVLARIDAVPDAMRTVLPSLPQELDDIVMRLLQPAPEDRFSTGEDLAAAFRRLQEVPRLADPKDAEARVLPTGWGQPLTAKARPGQPEATPAPAQVRLPREENGVLLQPTNLNKFDLTTLLRSFATSTRERGGFMMVTYRDSSDLVLYEGGRPQGCFRFDATGVTPIRGRQVLKQAAAQRDGTVACYSVNPELMRVLNVAFGSEPFMKNLRGNFIRFDGLVEELAAQRLDGFIRLRAGGAFSFLLYDQGQPTTAYLTGELLTSCDNNDPHREIARIIEHAALPVVIDVYAYQQERSTSGPSYTR